jgi:hypothetical protein
MIAIRMKNRLLVYTNSKYLVTIIKNIRKI